MLPRTYRGDVRYLIQVLQISLAKAADDFDPILEIGMREVAHSLGFYHFEGCDGRSARERTEAGTETGH